MLKKAKRSESKGQMVPHLCCYTLAHMYENTHRYFNTSTLYAVKSYSLVAEDETQDFTLTCISQFDLSNDEGNQFSQSTWSVEGCHTLLFMVMSG